MILSITGTPKIHYVDRMHKFEMFMQLAQYTTRSAIRTSYTLQTPLHSAHAVL